MLNRTCSLLLQARQLTTASACLQAANPAAEDVKAAMWWKGGHTHNPTTNDARNSDVADFWQASKGQAAGAIEHLTGEAWCLRRLYRDALCW